MWLLILSIAFKQVAAAGVFLVNLHKSHSGVKSEHLFSAIQGFGVLLSIWGCHPIPGQTPHSEFWQVAGAQRFLFVQGIRHCLYASLIRFISAHAGAITLVSSTLARLTITCRLLHEELQSLGGLVGSWLPSRDLLGSDLVSIQIRLWAATQSRQTYIEMQNVNFVT